MDDAQVLDITREAIIVLLKVGAPLMLIALVIGLLISLFQALTQMQEQTLSFVPKIMVMFLALIFLAPFMLGTLVTFTQGLFDLMAMPGL